MKCHKNSGRVRQDFDLVLACGDMRYRNLSARWDVVSCKRCLRTRKKVSKERKR